MWIANFFIIGLALVLLLFALTKSPALAFSGLKLGVGNLIGLLPVVLAAFAIAGLIQVLIPKETVSSWLGAEAGWKGLFLGSFAGALTPGGPWSTLPIAASLYKSGASAGVIAAYLAGWSLWAFPRLPVEIALLGPYLTAIRFLSTLIFPPIAGVIALWIIRLL